MYNLPIYKSHKTVRAAKINHIKTDPDDRSGGAMLVFEDSSIEDVPVDKEYIRKHNPQAGGYYVQYQDGYESFSPAEAFESGYSKL